MCRGRGKESLKETARWAWGPTWGWISSCISVLLKCQSVWLNVNLCGCLPHPPLHFFSVSYWISAHPGRSLLLNQWPLSNSHLPCTYFDIWLLFSFGMFLWITLFSGAVLSYFSFTCRIISSHDFLELLFSHAWKRLKFLRILSLAVLGWLFLQKIPNPPWWLVGGEGWHMISAQLKQEEEWFSKEWGVVSMRKSGQAELSRQKQQRSATSRVSHF